MNLKVKNNELVGVSQGRTIYFADELKIDNFTIPGPGEYEIGGILITVPEGGLYLIYCDDLHIIYWCACNGRPQIDSKDFGQVDALVLTLNEEKSSINDVSQVKNDMSPSIIVPAKPALLDKLIKSEAVSTKEAETWKIETVSEEKECQIVLLPCSKK